MFWPHAIPLRPGVSILSSPSGLSTDARLSPEQDQLIQRELRRRNDLLTNALLLLRHTGMSIGECVDLSFDCLRPLGPDQWAIHAN